VTLTYRDDDGQTDTDVVVITLGDTQAPVLTCPVNATAPGDPVTGSAFVNVLAAIVDNCDPNPFVTNDRTAGGRDASDTYPCGTTLVTFTARDAAGNTTTCVTNVFVTDTSSPALSCPATATADADAFGTAFVVVLASAVDGCDPNPAITNDRTLRGADASDTYPCGTTPVNFTANDASGNTSACRTIVIVNDVTPPLIDCPARIDQPAATTLGANVIVIATASDACDPTIPITNSRTSGGSDATGFYPCGLTNVTFTGLDDSGNRGTCTSVVNVFVPIPPVGMSPALRVAKSPPSDQYSTARLHWETATRQPWEHWEVRRTTTPASRPYPVLYSDPLFTATEFIDLSATALLHHYQVYTVDCSGGIAPDIMALSP
jgi:hypothetical protein